MTGDDCSTFATNNSITTSELYAWNPIVGAHGENCTSQFWAGYYYCVGTTSGGSTTSTVSSTLSASVVSSTTITASSIPSPTQAGSIISTCSKYTQAPSGGTCSDLATANGITLSQLGQWNSVLGTSGADCDTEFWCGYYYCVGVTSSSSTSTSSAVASATSPLTIPSPTQTGIVSNCGNFAEAHSGDYCSLFASDNNITEAQLYSWNTVLGTNGANCGTELWSGYYYCTGIS